MTSTGGGRTAAGEEFAKAPAHPEPVQGIAAGHRAPWGKMHAEKSGETLETSVAAYWFRIERDAWPKRT